MTRPLALSLIAVLLSGCAAGPRYQAPDAGELKLPSRYYAPDAENKAAENLDRWWSAFDDAEMTSLIDRAVAANLDIAQGIYRLRQAREAQRQARADLLPSISASAGANRAERSGGDWQNSYSAGLDAGWQVDLFGGLGSSLEAARADARSAYYSLADVQAAIVTQVAASYLDARLAQARLGNARRTLSIFDENLQIAQWRRQAGLVSSLDVEQARAARAQQEAQVPALEADFAAATYRLAVLLGEAPGALTPELSAPAAIPAAPADMGVGAPFALLRQRPDLRAAESDLAAATARIGVARAQLLPALNIGGSLGSSALSLGALPDNILGSLFAGLSQVIFDGGARASRVRQQQAAADAAYAGYRQTVLLALEDVENALAARASAWRRQASFAIALEAASNQALLARDQYNSGLTDFQSLLEAERALLSARDGVDSSRAALARASVDLYAALGGGWSDATLAHLEETK